jgi:RNA polymerase sigma factor (sigma-70 family)
MQPDRTQTDAHLIEQFLAGAESTFEAVVKRYGPLVMGVCRQILKHHQDAEDVFQETFLALARHAGEIRNRQVLASWLYEVAYRFAIRAGGRAARRRWVSMDLAERVSPEQTKGEAGRDELRLVLRAQLDRLQEVYRIVVVQCYLQGKSTKEVARLLGCPVGTVKGRLFRARKMLGRRLLQCGVLDLDQVTRRRA